MLVCNIWLCSTAQRDALLSACGLTENGWAAPSKEQIRVSCGSDSHHLPHPRQTHVRNGKHHGIFTPEVAGLCSGRRVTQDTDFLLFHLRFLPIPLPYFDLRMFPYY